MNQKQDPKRIMQDFKVRQSRQIIAIAVALFFVLLMAVVYKRPELFGEYSKRTIYLAQMVLISLFLAFTSANWRCPACNAFLNSDIHRQRCKKCGARLN